MLQESIKGVLLVIVSSLVLVAGLALWSTYEPANQSTATEFDPAGTTTTPLKSDTEELQADIKNMENNPTAAIKTNYGTITLELFAADMPITVENFVSLAQDGFYDNTKFHRVIAGFMIQGGDPNSREDDPSQYGTGGPGYTIADEFVSGEHLTNVVGTIAMANTGQPNSGGSQFFINVADNTNLDFDQQPLTSQHPVFGKVVDGMDVVQEIEQVEVGARDVPRTPVVIESITITQ